MDDQFAFRMPLDLSNIVGNVVQKVHTQLFRRDAEDGRKRFSDLVRNDLPISERGIRSAIHRGKVLLPLNRPEGRTGQLLIFD